MSNSDSPRDKYNFTADWFSVQIPNWEKWLNRLQGYPINALEIGTWEGRSAVWMLENILDNPSSHLTCIDLFPIQEVEDRFDNNISLTGYQNRVTKLKGVSWKHLRNLPPESFDLVYVDGSHDGRDVLEDAILTYRLTKVNGIIIFDDYPWEDNPMHSAYPKDAIDAFIKCYHDFISVIDMQWQVCIKKTR